MHESEKWKWSRSVVSDSPRPHGLQPTRLLRPWDFPGKSTGVGCHCLFRFSDYIHSIPSHRPQVLIPFKRGLFEITLGLKSLFFFPKRTNQELGKQWEVLFVGLVTDSRTFSIPYSAMLNTLCAFKLPVNKIKITPVKITSFKHWYQRVSNFLNTIYHPQSLHLLTKKEND